MAACSPLFSTHRVEDFCAAGIIGSMGQISTLLAADAEMVIAEKIVKLIIDNSLLCVFLVFSLYLSP